MTSQRKHGDLSSIVRDICHIFVELEHPGFVGRRRYSLWHQFFHLTAVIAKVFFFTLWYGRQTVHSTEKIQGKNWLVFSTSNNINSLTFLRKGLPDTVFVTTHSSPLLNKFPDYPRMSFHRGLQFFFHYPGIVRRLSSEMTWKNTIQNLDVVLEAGIYYYGALRMLRQQLPGSLTFSNDHNVKNRALLHAARKLGIPTIYLQHASVSADFPPLLFDLSLLDGKDALDKYRQSGPVAGRTELTGIAKFDPYAQKRKPVPARVGSIGICANLQDDAQGLITVAKRILAKLPHVKVNFRAHPRDQRHFDLPRQVYESDTRKEKIFDFLLRCDVIVACNTSTHLEAITMNIPSIYFEFGPVSISDYYGYVRNGLVPHARNISDLETLIMNPPKEDVYPKASYYNASIGTSWDGNVASKSLKIIREFLQKEKGRPVQ